MTDGELIALKCEPKRTWSSHWMGDQAIRKTTRSEWNGRKFINTVNAQGNRENPCSVQTPLWIGDPSRRQRETTGVKISQENLY